MTDEAKEKPPTVKEMIDDLGHLIGQQQDFTDEKFIALTEHLKSVSVLLDSGKAERGVMAARIDELEGELRWSRRLIERVIDRSLKLAPIDVNASDSSGSPIYR